MPEPLQLVAHRGYAAAWPENTAPALTAAVDAGARMLEFDVQMTRDGVPVLLHDETFARTGGNPSAVHDLDLADLADIDVCEADRFGSRHSPTPVCSLQRAVELMAGWPDVTAFIELKRQSMARFGVPAVVEAVLSDLHPVVDQCVIISFVAQALEETRRRCAAPVGWAVRTWDDASRRQAEELLPEYLFCNVDKLPADSADVWQGPWRWVIYEIVDADLAIRLHQQGFHCIETMAIAEMRHELEEGGYL